MMEEIAILYFLVDSNIIISMSATWKDFKDVSCWKRVLEQYLKYENNFHTFAKYFAVTIP